ncbi:hypothetical protein F3Y22_tig00013960pilonHSYRG00326 [Hibiscus syriacus]|uniref:Uncharacterized protein n=1 Tax=Hibiscus syriacus TaxID=106335 RepID=A0A6A3C5Y5_HIBSY|nr:hypothetical protein F3Y22_tig00013960pilonHSYRG00326 [Hibiscus syriacus]
MDSSFSTSDDLNKDREKQCWQKTWRFLLRSRLMKMTGNLRAEWSLRGLLIFGLDSFTHIIMDGAKIKYKEDKTLFTARSCVCVLLRVFLVGSPAGGGAANSALSVLSCVLVQQCCEACAFIVGSLVDGGAWLAIADVIADASGFLEACAEDTGPRKVVWGCVAQGVESEESFR